MLGRLARELPAGGFLYEPKWDGFRCLVFRDGDEIDLRSRHGRPLGRYFPELVGTLRSLERRRFVVDGEVVVRAEGGFDFADLLARIHPASSRIERLRRETPAAFIAFDVLALEDDDVRGRPFVERRRILSRLFGRAGPPLSLTRLTDDRAVASEWLESFGGGGGGGGGVDGVVAKHASLPYEPGRRTMVKVKPERTADCVVAGFRWLGDRPLPSSLLLGLYDGGGALRHVGVVTSFTEEGRRGVLREIAPLVVPLAGHPWQRGFLLAGGPVGRLKGSAGRWTPDMPQDWVPLAPELVCEVAYDQVDGGRFRHPAQFRRWRPDRDPASCTFDQLATTSVELRALLA